MIDILKCFKQGQEKLKYLQNMYVVRQQRQWHGLYPYKADDLSKTANNLSDQTKATIMKFVP